MNKSMSNNQLGNLRHSCAHLLAAAVKGLYPGAHNAIGPSIENGFYQDFDMGKWAISEADLLKIEKRMREMLKKWGPFEEKEVSVDQALKDFADNPYKVELIKDFAKEGKKITENDPGDFLDLCKGGHSNNPKVELKNFKLLSVAGAYWKGDEKKKMLTRIYGTLFPTKEELDKYLWQQVEAKKRDHRKLGAELDLFHFQSEAPGMPFWHPKGVVIRNELLQFSRKIQKKYNYLEVQAPNLLAVDLFKKSGHWNHYKENMFFSKGWGNKEYALRPMDCPGTIQIYKSHPHSYKELPLRLSEYGTVTRNEKSGELNGLFRVAQITQDDAHIFMREDQIQENVLETMRLAEEIYSAFRIPYKVYLSTRPDDFMGDIKVWNNSEASLKKAIEKQGLPLLLKEKDGAFYGPKIDYQLEDSLGRTWQCGTIQIDFQMPKVFELEYTGVNGNAYRPVINHRTIMGSIERFVGILIEHYAGAFPLWLSPVQVSVLPISEKQIEYTKKVREQLESSGLRVELNSENKTIGAKIRESTLQKIPYMVIIGEREVESLKSKVHQVSVRSREGKDLGLMNINEFITKLKSQIEKFL